MRVLSTLYAVGCLATAVSAGTSIASSPSSGSSSSDDSQPPYLPGANITTSGNGCPQSAADGKYLSATGSFAEMDFTLHNFTAVFGDGNSPSLKTTACEVHISAADAPAGYQVTPSNFSAGGFAVLEPGTTLTVLFTTYWSSAADNVLSFSKQYSNTANGTVTSLAVFEQDNQELWSPCIGSDGLLPLLNVNYRAAFTSTVVNPDGTAPFAYFGPLFVNGQEQYHVTEDIQYKWRACTPSS